MSALIKASGLVRHFRRRGGKSPVQALRGVDFTLVPGESVGIAGESGCGKSTLAMLLLGLDRPTKGDIALNGSDIARLTKRDIASVTQPVFQDPLSSLNPRHTLETIVRGPLDAMRIGTRAERRARAAKLLAQVGMPERFLHTYPRQLSGGQAQRVAIARALASSPRALICDEPTSALDTSVQAQILNLLMDLREKTGIAVVMISHDLKVLELTCDRIVVMYLGKVVEQGPARTVTSAPRHPYTRALLASSLEPDPTLDLPPEEANPAPPNPAAIPEGCSFRARCPMAIDRCAIEEPPLVAMGQGMVACHRAGATNG